VLCFSKATYERLLLVRNRGNHAQGEKRKHGSDGFVPFLRAATVAQGKRLRSIVGCGLRAVKANGGLPAKFVKII
jgi:hypothetical protein